MKFSKHYSATLDLQLLAPNKAESESAIEKIKNQIVKVLAEKFGSAKSGCHIEGYSEIEISVEEMKVLFDRQDQNNTDLRENWEKDLQIASEICNKVIDASVECSKKFLKGVAEVVNEYDRIDAEFNYADPNHGNVTSEPEE